MVPSGDQPARYGDVSVRAADVERWIAQAREGDGESLGELIAQCRGYLLANAHAQLDDTLRGKLAVSDVVQETLLRVQQHFAGFRGSNEEELLAWFRQILINYIADVRRSYRQTDKRNIDREVEFPWNDDTTAMALQRLAVDSATPGGAAAQEEEIGRLRAALAALPDEYRQVLTLRTWERLSFSEVGRRMGRSADAARMLWARAVQRLSAALQGSNDDSS